MFKIKICGVTRVEDIEVSAAAGADAIGINVIPSSPRCVSLERARILADAAHDLGVKSVVVVMDAGSSELARIARCVEPHAIQLHGRETPAMISDLDIGHIVKALSWTGREEESELAAAWIEEAPRIELSFLVDAYAPSVGGGTGKVARWDMLKPRPIQLAPVPMLLAGGLTPENVADAIRATDCVGVDTASGVESAPGIKDKGRVEAFVRAAQAAFER